MAKCDPVTYQGVTPQIFASLKQELEGNGFTIPGTSGVISGPYGIVMEYNWDEASEVLYTHVIDKSFFVPCSQINDQLSRALTKYTA